MPVIGTCLRDAVSEMTDEKATEFKLSEFIEVHFLDVVMTQAYRPVGYTPTVMLKDNINRVIAIPIGRLNHTMMSEALENKSGTYQFLLEIFRDIRLQIESAFIYDIEGTSVSDLTFLSKIKLKNIVSNEVMFVKGDPSDVLPLALISEAPIYIKKNIIDKISTKLR